MGNKRFQNLLLKNTVAIAIPAMAVFLILIFVFSRYPVMEQVKCHKIDNQDLSNEKLSELLAEETTNIKYTAENLYYTGFDYYIDGKAEGAYYYMMNDNNIVFFLIKTKNPSMHIDSITIKGKIVRDYVSTEHILSRLSENTGLDDKKIFEYNSGYLISEPDYPKALITMVYMFFYAPIVICVLILSYTVLVWLNPIMHGQTKQLAAYGEPEYIVEELNLQLKKKLVYRKNNIYITEDYMIVTYLTKTDVIKLDYIKYLSKNLVEKESQGHKKEMVYRLTMSNPEKMFYEVDFSSEALADDVVRYIRGVNKTP